MCTLKNLEENWKTWKNFEKTSGNPELRLKKLEFEKKTGKNLNFEQKSLNSSKPRVLNNYYTLSSKMLI